MTGPAVRDVFDCSGRVAVVTGAAGILGPVWVDTLLGAGAAVAMLLEPGRPEPPGLSALRRSGRVLAVEADIERRSELEAAHREITAAFGEVDILVANAGRDHAPTSAARLRLAELTAGDVEHVVATNVTGTLLSISVFGGAMVRSGRGSVVLVGSQYSVISPRPRVYEYLGGPDPFVKNPAYGASKAAVVNLARYFAAHWGPAGVRVNALSPGGVHSGQDPAFVAAFSREVPLGRMVRPEELRGALLFLASEAGSYVTGSHLVVDGGYSIW